MSSKNWLTSSLVAEGHTEPDGPLDAIDRENDPVYTEADTDDLPALPQRVKGATLTPEYIAAGAPVPTADEVERARLLAVAEECELGDNAEMARICRAAAYSIPTAAVLDQPYETHHPRRCYCIQFAPGHAPGLTGMWARCKGDTHHPHDAETCPACLAGATDFHEVAPDDDLDAPVPYVPVSMSDDAGPDAEAVAKVSAPVITGPSSVAGVAALRFSHPAHTIATPSLVQLDQVAAAEHLADAVTDLLALIGSMTFGPDDNVAPVRQALADFRAVTK